VIMAKTGVRNEQISWNGAHAMEDSFDWCCLQEKNDKLSYFLKDCLTVGCLRVRYCFVSIWLI
jgi:hypothetical protein